MCNGSNVNFPGDRALSGLIQKWEQEERKKLLAAPQVSEIAVDISCPAVSEGCCSLGALESGWVIQCTKPLSAVLSLSFSCLEMAFGFCFLYQT